MDAGIGCSGWWVVDATGFPLFSQFSRSRFLGWQFSFNLCRVRLIVDHRFVGPAVVPFRCALSVCSLSSLLFAHSAFPASFLLGRIFRTLAVVVGVAGLTVRRECGNGVRCRRRGVKSSTPTRSSRELWECAAGC